MNPNARHIIERKPRSKLRAFGDECPEVKEVVQEAAIALQLLGQHDLAARLIVLSAAMSEPPR